MAPKMAPPSTSKSTFRTCKRTKNQNRNTRRRKYAVAMNQNQKKDASFFPTTIQKKQLLTVQNRHFTERSKPTSKHTPHTQCPKHHKHPECSRKEKRAAQPTTQTCSGQPVRKEARYSITREAKNGSSKLLNNNSCQHKNSPKQKPEKTSTK